MKKMMLLAGLLCVYGLNYAATSDDFIVKAKVVEPVAIELNNDTLNFENVIRGTVGMAKNTITATITGEKDSVVRVNFKAGNENITDGNVTLATDAGDELTAKLYLNNNVQDIMAETAFPLDNGTVSFDINGMLDVPVEAVSGEYSSKEITVSVIYDTFAKE